MCNEVKLYYVHLWNSFVASENMFMRDGLHLSGRVYGFFADNFNRTFDSGLKNENYLKYIVLFNGDCEKRTRDKNVTVMQR